MAPAWYTDFAGVRSGLPDCAAQHVHEVPHLEDTSHSGDVLAAEPGANPTI